MNRIEAEKALSQMPEDKVVKLTLLNKHGGIYSMHEHTVGAMMYRKGGSSTTRDKFRSKIGREVDCNLEFGGSLLISEV